MFPEAALGVLESEFQKAVAGHSSLGTCRSAPAFGGLDPKRHTHGLTTIQMTFVDTHFRFLDEWMMTHTIDEAGIALHGLLLLRRQDVGLVYQRIVRYWYKYGVLVLLLMQG